MPYINLIIIYDPFANFNLNSQIGVYLIKKLNPKQIRCLH